MSRKRKPYNRIKAYFVENEIKHQQVASVLKMTSNTITKKLNGFGADFKLSEAKIMHEELGVPIAYFFEPGVPKKEQKII
ncbi:MAG: XRE family transcriptional regulator [Psychrobacillus psychrodurans]